MTPLLRVIFVGCGLSAVVCHAQPADEDAKNVFAKVSASVVTINAVDAEGADDGQGSGVVIGKGLVVTNCHVVRDAASMSVGNSTGKFAGRWITQDPKRDICLLAVNDLAAPAVALRPGNFLVVGEPMFAVGNPLGFGLAVSQGLVTVVETQAGQTVLVTSTPQSPGSSGGGLFDRQGRLVGITTAILGTGQNLNLALSSDGLEQLAATGSPPKRPVAAPAAEHRWADEAAALQTSSDWPKLEAHAKAWSAAQPSAAEALVYIGSAQQALNRHADAEATLRRALDLDDYYPYAWLKYGITLRKLGRQAEAEKALLQAEALAPSYAEPNAVRAEWLRLDGHMDEARQHMQESLRRNAGSSWAWRTLGLIEDARGDNAAALRAYKTAVRLGETEADVAQRLTQLLADSGKADEASRVAANATLGNMEAALNQVAIGLAEMQRGRLGPAEEAMRKAIALAPDLADAWTGLGTVMIYTGRTAEAERNYDQAVKLSPDNPQMLTDRAAARRALAQMVPALADARHAIALDPNYAGAWRIYGVVQMETRNFKEAVLGFGRVDGLGKATADDLVSLGEALAETGDVNNGLKALARAEAMNASLVRMCLSTAKVLGRNGDVNKAISYSERALKQEPTNPNAWSSKGYALIKLGRLPEAVEALETTVRLAPEFANGWINLGEAQMRSRNLGRAIEALEKAVTLAPEAMDARFFLAQSYLGARLPAKSREHAERLLSKQPSFAPALGVLTMTYLMEGNLSSATPPYLKLKSLLPTDARSLRDQAIAGGLGIARGLPD
jgi:tetratricopeptide (TPR) repeat protein